MYIVLKEINSPANFATTFETFIFGVKYDFMLICKNCSKPLEENFCSRCGQRARVGQITVLNLLRDLPHAVFHVDRGFLYNLVQLFRRPGDAINDYIEGKRRPFYHPATFLVISLILNYLVVKVTDLHFYDEHELVSMDALAAKAIKDYDALQWWFLEHTYIYILLAIPASSLFLFGIFKMMRHTFNVAETCVVVLFTIAQGVLIQTFIYLCFGWVKSGPFLRTVESVNMCILIFYASLVIYQLLPAFHSKVKRGIVSFFAGTGLALVWIASAYLLYVLMT